MILYGGYARGGDRRGTAVTEAAYRAMIDLARVGVGQGQSDVPSGLHVALHSRRQPRAAAVVQRPLPEDDHRRDRGAAVRGARGASTSRSSCGRCARRRSSCTRATTRSIPIAEGRLLASGIPGAEFVELDSRNHILLEHEPAWQRFQEAVLAFLQPEPAAAAIRCSRLVGARASGAGAHRRGPEQHRHRRAPAASARRRSAITRRTCSTSSACGRARRRSCSRAITASAADAEGGKLAGRQGFETRETGFFN